MNKLLFVLALNIAFISHLGAQSTNRERWPDHFEIDFLGYLYSGVYFNPGETEATVEIDVPLSSGLIITQAYSSVGLATIDGNKVFFTFRKNKLQRELEGISPAELQIPGTIRVGPHYGQEKGTYLVSIGWDYNNLFNEH